MDMVKTTIIQILNSPEGYYANSNSSPVKPIARE